MKKSYLPFIVLLFLIQLTSGQTYQWVRHNSHSISFNPDYALFPSVTDVSNNIIIGTILNFKQVYSTAFYGDVIVRKYNSSGSQILTRTILGKANIKGIETDAGNNIYVYGSFMDTLRIDSANTIFNTGSGFNLNSYLIKFSSTGSVLWKKNITSIYGNNAAISSLKHKNNILYSTVMQQAFNGFIKKFDLNGNEVLSSAFDNIRTLSAVDADASGNIFAAGSCGNGNIQFGGLNLSSPYVYSLYFVKLSSAGTGTWAKLVQDVTFEEPLIVCDNSGSAYASGSLNSNFLFGNIQTQGPQWVYDFYVTKMDASGNFLWVKEVPNIGGSPTGDAATGQLTSLKVDAQNNVYFAGMQRGTINWGSFSTTSAGSNDVLVLKYNSNGNLLWGKTAGASSLERSDAISLDNLNNIYISGNFSNNSAFDTIIVSGTGQINSFIAKLSNPAVTGIANNNIPLNFSLSNYPNPFNPSTKISYALQMKNEVRLAVFDIKGKEVAVLVNGIQDAGNYEIEWNAEGFSSGIYFCRIESEIYTNTIKMLLVK